MIKKPLKRYGDRRQARVLIVDAQPLTRHGLRKLLAKQPGMQICGEAGDYSQALTTINDTNPDLVTVEIALNRASGLELIREVRARFPQIALLAISHHDEVFYAERALRAGAAGYVHKLETLPNVAKAVRAVLRGEMYVSGPIASRLAAKIAGRRNRAANIMDGLTDRELEVFGLIGEGFGPRQIEDRLDIKKSTVETYRNRIKHKLRLKNAAEMRQEAVAWKRSQKIFP